MAEEIECRPEVKPARIQPSIVVASVLLVLMTVTFFLRVWRLESITPGLHLDESAYGVDVQDLLRGEFRAFFPRNYGREPLFNYLAVPFVAVWNGRPIAIRLVAAILGTLMVPALFFAGKALWKRPRMGVWGGIAAAAFWMVNYWPQSVNRLAFHVNTLPLVLTLAVIAWLKWTYDPTRRRALTFGFLAGLTLTTYLSARITPFLWLLLYFTLPSPKRKRLRATLSWAFLAFLVTVAPLIAHFALHSEDFGARMGSLGLLGSAPSLGQSARILLGSLSNVVGVFLGGAGDPQLSHNLPGRPPFPLHFATLVVLGLALAFVGLRRRDQAAWTLLLWFPILSVPAILIPEESPHFLRLLGALPAALLLAAWPVAWLGEWSKGKGRHLEAIVILLLVVLIGVEGARTARDYFVTWAEDPDLYTWFQGDTWLLSQRIAETPGAIGVVPLDPRTPPGVSIYTLDYVCGDKSIQMKVDEADIEEWLDDHLGNAVGSRPMVPVWHEPALADPKGILIFYLTREGSEESRELFSLFDLVTFSLDRSPQFQAAGHRSSPNQLFSSTLTLVEARYGVGYPNPDSNGDTAAAGTTVWAILTWRLERPSSDLKVALDLVDRQGHRLDSAEVPLLNAQRLPVSQWETGTSGQSYHLVTVPPTQPPGSAVLESRAYDAQTTIPLTAQGGTPRGSEGVGTVSVTAAREPLTVDTLAVSQPIHVVFPPAITLLGLDPWPAEIAPGQRLTLRLFWQVETPPSSTQVYTVSLDSTGVFTTVHLPPDLPVGQAVHTYADLDLPPGLPTGTSEILLTSPDGISPVKLGQVEVVGRPHRFQAPPLQMPLRAGFGNAVDLLGVDVAGELQAAPGETLEFNLAWQAMGTAREDLVRFVHLLGPDGHPVAQEDTVPCAGACPASSWLQNEVLVEEVRLALPADLPSGNYPLALGWYDASTLERLPARDANGQPLTEDLLILPLRVVVAP